MPRTNGAKMQRRFSSPEEIAQRKWLRASEFCVIYGRSRSWLTNAVRDGHIVATKIGRSLMVSAESAEKLFREGC